MRNLIKKILKEENEFDWVDISTDNLSGQRLYSLIQNYFKEYVNGTYWLEMDGGDVQIWDETGIYYDFNIDEFTIPNLIEKIQRTIWFYTFKIKDPNLKEDYLRLAKTLEPIIGPINAPPW